MILSFFTHFKLLKSEFSVLFWFWFRTKSEQNKIFFLWNETESVFFWWDETELDFFLWDETESDFFSWDETEQKTEAVLMRQNQIFMRQNVSFWFFSQSKHIWISCYRKENHIYFTDKNQNRSSKIQKKKMITFQSWIKE